MCRAATCSRCGKMTWKGCGQHVDQVMREVAKADRCTCPSERPAPAAAPSWRSRLFGR